MSNGDFQHETDDELLSAYIDGELSETERAAVETRLAADPEAQQLVHQLRSVSQSVQRLPLEKVGRDLSEAILRRAEAMKPMPAAAKGAATTASSAAAARDSHSSGGIFQSRRPWIWASLALAAGLMIMVFQRGAENQNLPAVASNTEGRGSERGRQLQESPELGRVADREAPRPAADPKQLAESGPALMAPNSPSDALSPTKSDALGDEKSANESNYAYAFRSGEPKGEPQPATGAAPATSPSTPMLTDVPTDKELRKGIVVTRPASPAPVNVADGRSTTVTPPAAQLPPASAAEPPAPAVATEKGMQLEVDATRSEAATLGGKASNPAPSDVAAAQPGGGRGFGGGVGGAGAFYDTSGRFYSAVEGKQVPVVVHVVASTESFRQQSIDNLLTKHGVLVELNQQTADKNTSGNRFAGATSGLRGGGAKELSTAAKLKTANDGADADFDFVLVDAPKDTIASCLNDLNKDAANYVSVEIVEPSASKDGAEQGGERNKKVASDFGKFNRGAAVSKEQKLAFQNYYSQLDAAGKESGKSEGEKVDGYVEELSAIDAEKLAKDTRKNSASSRGPDVQARARRLSRADFGDEAIDATAPAGALADTQAAKPPMELRRAQTPDKPAAGAAAPEQKLQVLFVITCQQPTAAAAAAATSAPAEPSPATKKASK